MMERSFVEKCRLYFEESDRFLELLKEDPVQGFFLNTRKAEREKILKLIDFPYERSGLHPDSFIHHNDSIGKTVVNELGLIYPQESASSAFGRYLDYSRVRTVVDLCSAPGGKTIDVLNGCDSDVLCIANDVSHSRALVLSSNLERLGLSNVIITNKETSQLAKELQGFGDLVILDAPCSGEGMIRKYPEILDSYSPENIRSLSLLQKDLLEDAYRILKKDGTLVYSTCTYAFEEDEDQIAGFLQRHQDMELLPVTCDSYSRMEGTVKLCPLGGSEGQFFAIMRKKEDSGETKIRYLKESRNKLAEDFIRDDLDLEEYHLYEYNGHFHLSLFPLPDLGRQIIRYGICLGDAVNRRFEPHHDLYRSNDLKGRFRHVIDLNDEEYRKYIAGYELKKDCGNHHYLLTYKDHSLGHAKGTNGVLKNKYPKGLRTML